MSFLNWKTVLLAGFTLLLLIAIPFTLYTLQQPTDTRTQALASTTLSIVAPDGVTLNPKVGDVFSVDLLVTPGSNQVSIIDTEVTYDSEILEVATPSAHTSTTTDGRVLLLDYSDTPPTGKLSFSEPAGFATPGKIILKLTSGATAENIIQSPSRVAKITFKAKKAGSTSIGFGANPQIRSAGADDGTSENVFSSANPLSLTVAQTTTPTTTPTATPSASVTNKPPTCTSFVVDRSTTGAAPFAITFTATGNDSDGTISKATFNFGNGPVRDVTTGNGIGTANVSIPLSNSYQNAGTFQASVIFTDNQGAVSVTGTCTQTITVTQAVVPTTPPVVQNPTAIPTAPIVQVQPTQPVGNPLPIEPTGPGETFTILGGIAAIATIIGGILFFSL